MAGNSDDDIETQSHGKRARSEDCTDRISNLPKDLIHNIMQRLPISLAARMSVLSKSWRGNWESMPHLEFDNDFADTFINNNDEVVDTHEWSSIISNILFHHEGPIKAFHLTVPDTDDTTDLVISSWILYVSRNGVTSFKLINGSMESLVELPSRLFSCMLLEDLSLVGCAISHLPHITGFRKLLHLELVNVQFKGEMLREFVASSPLLETLILLGCSNDDHLTINLPALKNLELSGFFRSITFNNTSSLLSVSLFLLLEAPYTFEGAADMIQFLASSCKLQRLSISHFQILADGGISSILPTTFRNLKILNLSSIDISSIHYFMCAIGMIRSCPNMEELKIQFREYPFNPMQEVLEDGVIDNDPKHAFYHLRSIYIGIYRGLTVERKLISYLLHLSPSLERLSYTCHRELETDAKSQLCRELMQLSRASLNVEVVEG